MYQVIKMYGDWEPWWFIEGWQDDIVEEHCFDNWQEALNYYEKEWAQMKIDYSSFHSQRNLLATFWTRSEKRWCEDCYDDLQQYHSILLLKDKDIIPKDKYLDRYEQRNDDPTSPSTCKLKF